MFLKFGIASNKIIMRIVLGKSGNLQNKGYRRSTSNSGHTLWSRPDTRKSLLDGLAEKGYGSEQLTEISRLY